MSDANLSDDDPVLTTKDAGATKEELPKELAVALGGGVKLELVRIDKGDFQMVIRGWGTSTNPHPQFAYDGTLIRYTVRSANAGGKGMAFPLKQKTDSAGDVDFEQLVVDSGVGLDVEKQKGNVAKIVQAFNELLPILPLYERFGNNPILESGDKVRVTGWPKDTDDILKNSAYADSYVIMSMLDGKLQPK